MSLMTYSKVKETLEKVNQKLLLPKDLVDNIDILFVKNKKFYGRAEVDRYAFGTIVYGERKPQYECRIKLSDPLLSVFGEDRQEITIAHELCHIADFYFNGKMNAHQYQWQQLMVKAGYEPNATGPSLPCDVPGMAKAKCSCRTHAITTNRATRMKKGSRYRCSYCLTEMELVYG